MQYSYFLTVFMSLLSRLFLIQIFSLQDLHSESDHIIIGHNVLVGITIFQGRRNDQGARGRA